MGKVTFACGIIQSVWFLDSELLSHNYVVCIVYVVYEVSCYWPDTYSKITSIL